MAQHREVMHGDDERCTGSERRAEGRTMEDVEAGRGGAETDGIPQRVASQGGETSLPAGRQANELETGPVGERA